MNRIAFAMIAAASAACLMPAHAAFAADAEGCKAVRLSDLGWTDISFTNTTAEIILGALGYEPSQTLLALNVTFDSMKNGDIDVFLGNWRPVQDLDYKAYFDDGSVVPVATNLTGAKYTLAVPRYVYDAGLKSFNDLQTHADKLGRKIYGIEPGSNKPLLDMVESKAHGLDDGWEVVESSEAAMLTQVQRAAKTKDWIVFLGWQPHPMNVNMDLAYLGGGDAEFGPDFGGATVRTVVRKGYREQCPNVTAFFSNLVFDIDYENAGMNMIMTDGLDAREAAVKMLKAHPELLDSWLKGVTTFDGKPPVDAVKSELGLQ